MKPLALTIIAFTFFQCTIEKRVHQKGYHVEWNSHKYSDSKATKETVSDAKEIDTTAPGTIIVQENITTATPSIDDHANQEGEVKIIEITKPTNSFENGNKCGVIVLNSGRKIEYSSSKVVDNKLLYKVCHDRLSFWKEIELTDVLTIYKANGEIIYSAQDKTQTKKQDPLQINQLKQKLEDPVTKRSKRYGRMSLTIFWISIFLFLTTIFLEYIWVIGTVLTIHFLLIIGILFTIALILSIISLIILLENTHLYKKKLPQIAILVFSLLMATICLFFGSKVSENVL